MLKSSIVFAAVVLLLAVTAVVNGDNEKDSTEQKKQDKAELKTVTTGSGLKYIDLKVGEGKAAENDMKVRVNYTLWLDVNGEKGRMIDSSIEGKQKPEPFDFTVGMKGLVAGWNEGMLGMKKGGLRRLYLSADLGWGVKGRPPMIPANADVIFEIELLDFL